MGLETGVDGLAVEFVVEWRGRKSSALESERLAIAPAPPDGLALTALLKPPHSVLMTM